MRKSILLLFGLAFLHSVVAQQIPSPSWTITQNASLPGISAGIRFLDAVDANTVWAIGYDGAAFARNYNWWCKTVNGGASFTSGNCFADTNTYVLSNIEGIDGNVAWVASSLKVNSSKGAVHKTTDGGSTWTNMITPSMFTNTNSFVDFVSMLTPSNGIVVGDPIPVGSNLDFEIYTTSNAGATWTAVTPTNIPDPVAGEYGLANVYTKQGSSNYWFGTNKNRIYRSTDGGLTWSVSAALTSTIGAPLEIADIAFTDASNGLARVWFGSLSNASVTLWNTNDGGATWNKLQSLDPNFGKSDMCAIPGTSWFASVGASVGNNIISFSANNGLSWNSWGSTGIQYLNIDFVDPSKGWAGTFSDVNAPGIGGFYRYSGGNLTQPATAGFTMTTWNCVNEGVPVKNISGGNPFPSYTWSVDPAALITNSTAANPMFTFTTSGVYTVYLTATNPSTSTSVSHTLTIAPTGCTGIFENTSLDLNLNIYPNPSSQKLFMEINELKKLDYQLMDACGRIVAEGQARELHQCVDLSLFGKGIYFLKVSCDGENALRKIVVE